MNGAYLKQLRKSKGITQDDLAKALGYSDRSAISRIENDSFDLTQDKIKQYADFFNVSVLDILGVRDEQPSNSESDLLSMFRQLNDQGKAMALEYIRWLLTKYST